MGFKIRFLSGFYYPLKNWWNKLDDSTAGKAKKSLILNDEEMIKHFIQTK